MAKLTGVSVIEVIAAKTPNLDTDCFRGLGPVAATSRQSHRPTLDEVTNPKGLQRDLSPSTLKRSLQYVNRKPNPEDRGVS